jgi:hypothetical protein
VAPAISHRRLGWRGQSLSTNISQAAILSLLENDDRTPIALVANLNVWRHDTATMRTQITKLLFILSVAVYAYGCATSHRQALGLVDDEMIGAMIADRSTWMDGPAF